VAASLRCCTDGCSHVGMFRVRRYVYHTILDVPSVVKEDHFNVWGVVKDFTPIKMTRGSDLSMSLKIVDDSGGSERVLPCVLFRFATLSVCVDIGDDQDRLEDRAPEPSPLRTLAQPLFEFPLHHH
jgi:hypothetical protein